jgi:hypothetical protein
MPAHAAGEMADTAGASLTESEVTMIRTLYAVVQQRSWNRDRSRRIAVMLDRERTIPMADLDRLDALTCQLAQIRALPEAPEPPR